MTTNFLQQVSDLETSCPCGKAGRLEMERISRGPFVRNFLFFLPLRKYRCAKCKRVKWEMRKRYWQRSI